MVSIRLVFQTHLASDNLMLLKSHSDDSNKAEYTAPVARLATAAAP